MQLLGKKSRICSNFRACLESLAVCNSLAAIWPTPHVLFRVIRDRNAGEQAVNEGLSVGIQECQYFYSQGKLSKSKKHTWATSFMCKSAEQVREAALSPSPKELTPRCLLSRCLLLSLALRKQTRPFTLLFYLRS